MGAVLRRVVPTGVLLGAAIACRQIVGIGEGPPTGPTPADAAGDAPACGIAYAGARCEGCVEAHCCREASQCASDPSCATTAACLASCAGDPTCLARCTYGTVPPSSAPSTVALDTCLAQSCEQDCSLSCGPTLYVEPDAAASCHACFETNACAIGHDCAASSTCAAENLCAVSCEGRLDCLTGCGALGDGGSSMWQALAQVVQGTCAAPCAIGSNWGCLDHVSPPASNGQPTEVDVDTVLLGTSTSVPGVQVAVCSVGSCGAPAGPTPSDGSPVAVAVPTTSANHGGFLGPTGYLELTSAADAGSSIIEPEDLYWGFPLSQPRMDLAAYVVTPLVLSVLYGGAGQGTAPMQGRGTIIVGALDCANIRATGIAFDTGQPAPTHTFYIRGMGVDPSATQTDRSGAAVITNVMPGSVTVTATATQLGKVVSRVPVTVRDGAVTLLYMPPSP